MDGGEWSVVAAEGSVVVVDFGVDGGEWSVVAAEGGVVVVNFGVDGGEWNVVEDGVAEGVQGVADRRGWSWR